MDKSYICHGRREGGKGVPRVQTMKNELECLGDRKGHDDHLAKKFLLKYYF